MKKICFLTLLSMLLISCSNNVELVPTRSNLGDDTKLVDLIKSKPNLSHMVMAWITVELAHHYILKVQVVDLMHQ